VDLLKGHGATEAELRARGIEVLEVDPGRHADAASLDWGDYPDHPRVPMPEGEGPFRILEGEEYIEARARADAANKALHRMYPELKGYEIHEIVPVKWGGSPTDLSNKIALLPGEHRPFTFWWAGQQRRLAD